MIRTIQFLGAALGGLIGITFVIAQLAVFQPAPGAALLVIGWVVAWIVLGYTLLPYLTVIPAGKALRSVQALSTAEFVTAIIGLFLGLLLGLLLGLPMSELPGTIGMVAPLGISVFLGLAMVGLTVAKRHDLISAAEAMGLIRRPPGDGEGGNVPRILVDTSAIIDGRIADIADSGFLYGILEIPRFVLDEVQRLADSSDSMRRTRGRRGLEILARMRKTGTTPVVVIDEDVPGTPEVDSKLVALAHEERPRRAHQRPQSQPDRRPAGRPRPERELAGQRREARAAPGRGSPRARDPAGQGRRAGCRLPRRRHDGRGRGRGEPRSTRDVEVTVTRVLQTVAGRMVFAHPRQA